MEKGSQLFKKVSMCDSTNDTWAVTKEQAQLVVLWHRVPSSKIGKCKSDKLYSFIKASALTLKCLDSQET